jgi:hypothetical protein
VNQKRTQRTRPDHTGPGFGSRQLTAALDRIFFGREVPNPRARPGPPRWGARALRFGCRCAGLGSFAFLAGASAQSDLAPPPLDLSGTVQGPQLPQGPPMGTSVLSAPPTAPLPDVPLLQWGQVSFYPHLLYRFLYGDGIPAQANQKFTTAINQIYPGILFQVGSHWHLDYTPCLTYYSSSQFRNTTDQSVVLAGTTTYENWTLGLSQGYVTTSQPLIETGAQTDFDNYNTAINAAYHFNTQASLEMGLNQSFQYVGQNPSPEQLVDSKVWSTMDWFNYQFWPRFGAALGVSAGYVDLSVGSPLSYEELQARITWQVGAKLSVQVNAGVEDLQILEVNTPDLTTPIFGAAIVYRPFEATSVSLNAGRSVMTSYYVLSQVTENTYVSVSLHQRLFKKLLFDLSGGYGITSYLATFVGLAQSREDDYTFVNARLSVPFLKRGTAGVFYQASKDTSTVAQFQISSTQVGFDLGYHF